MPFSPIAQIDTNALAHNYHILLKRAKTAICMAVLKADAYGHGLIPIAQTLYQQGCRQFAISDVQEGIRLRQSLPQQASILVLSGIHHRDEVAALSEHQLASTIYHKQQLQLLSEYKQHSIDIWLKLNTGMNRLGFDHALQAIAQAQQSHCHIKGLLSHLGCADEPLHAQNQQQLQAFKAIMTACQPPIAGSLLNSAGLRHFPEHRYQMVRPGIALYGIEAEHKHALGLKPVMQLEGKIIQCRNLKAGESLSYGASYRCKHDSKIAIIRLGYADGLPRCLSNKTQVCIHQQLYPLVGRICMDYCFVDLGQQATAIDIGTSVVFWGEAIKASDVAAQAETIAYELFTSVSPRVKRHYVEGFR